MDRLAWASYLTVSGTNCSIQYRTAAILNQAATFNMNLLSIIWNKGSQKYPSASIDKALAYLTCWKEAFQMAQAAAIEEPSVSEGKKHDAWETKGVLEFGCLMTIHTQSRFQRGC